MIAGPLRTRGQIGAALGASKAAVSRAVDVLLTDGRLVEGPRVGDGPGRKTVTLQPRADIGFLAGGDLEGLAMRACVLDAAGIVRVRRREPIDPAWSPEQIVARWMDLIARATDEADVPTGRLVGVGLGLPGAVRAGELHLRTYMPPGRWVDLDIADSAAGLGAPVAAANNALCVAEYERRLGCMRTADSFIGVLVRYGIGAAVYANGAFVVGEQVLAGELGHVRLALRGRRCVCGARGCLDAYCSGRTLPPRPDRSSAAWRQELARRTRRLGVGVGNLLKVIHAPKVVINGVYNAYADDLAGPLAETVAEELAPAGLPPAEVVFGDDEQAKAGIGAALRAGGALLEEYLQSRTPRPRAHRPVAAAPATEIADG